jgi:competence protein ComEC
MNSYIQQIDSISFSLWDSLQINLVQVVLLFIFIAGISHWLFQRSKPAFMTGLLSLSLFFVIRSVSFRQAYAQQRVVIYNVTRHQAMDIINGRRLTFVGDREVIADDFIKNFHFKPARTAQRLWANDTSGLLRKGNFISLSGIKILLADTSLIFKSPRKRVKLDLLVISKNPSLYLPGLKQTFEIKQIVFDASVPAWKIRNWKKDCDSLHIPYYDVSEKGAFVMNVN